MQRERTWIPIAAALAALLGCGGDGGTSNNNGVVQIASFIMSPQTISCGLTINPPLRNIGAPDSVIMQVKLVNTTADTLFMQSAGGYGQVIRADAAEDVGHVSLNSESLPFIPNPAIIRSHDGDVDIRVTFATDPICQTKALFYTGTQDLNISARMTTSKGQYVTQFLPLHVEWR